MNAFGYILAKQVLWARNNKIHLIGSKGGRGRLAYTSTIEDNLFEPLEQSVRGEFEQGDGGELLGNACKMSAIHSSSALGINIFQYWAKSNQVPLIAAACGFCSKDSKVSCGIKFEQKIAISEKFTPTPNIDVIINNIGDSRFKVFAVECKFSEAYSLRGHGGLKKKYLDAHEIWDGLPNVRSFARTISPTDNRFNHLHPAQLVKHILGLTNVYGHNKFRLLYLWYDCPGQEGACHRDEIERFMAITKKDGINFHALSYQGLIIKLANDCGAEHERYINYIASRYL